MFFLAIRDRLLMIALQMQMDLHAIQKLLLAIVEATTIHKSAILGQPWSTKTSFPKCLAQLGSLKDALRTIIREWCLTFSVSFLIEKSARSWLSRKAITHSLFSAILNASAVSHLPTISLVKPQPAVIWAQFGPKMSMLRLKRNLH